MAKPRSRLPQVLTVKVTRDDIAKAIMAKSTGCAISDAAARCYPDSTRQLSDIRSLRLTFPELGERAEYKMSVMGSRFIVLFDRGIPNLDGFTLKLELAVHRPIVVGPKAQTERQAAHKERQAKVARGEALTSDEKRAENIYKGAKRSTSAGKANYTKDRHGNAVQTGGRFTEIAPGASGPSKSAKSRDSNQMAFPVSDNQWAESGPSQTRGRPPRHARGFGVHAMGDFDPDVLESAGQIYGEATADKSTRRSI